MFGIELDLINDEFNGFGIAIVDNIEVRCIDSVTLALVPNCTIVVSGSINNNGTYNVNELNIFEPTGSTITITGSAPNYAGDFETFVFIGENGFKYVDLLLVKITLEFDCEIETFNEAGASLGGRISTNENTIIKSRFTTTTNVVPALGLYKCILYQYFSNGTTDEGVFEVQPTIEEVDGFALVYSISLTPQQAIDRGDSITSRLILL